MINRIQIETQFIFDVLVYDNNQNISLKISKHIFISVGIGELHYSEFHVTKGELDNITKTRDVIL